MGVCFLICCSLLCCPDDLIHILIFSLMAAGSFFFFASYSTFWGFFSSCLCPKWMRIDITILAEAPRRNNCLWIEAARSHCLEGCTSFLLRETWYFTCLLRACTTGSLSPVSSAPVVPTFMDLFLALLNYYVNYDISLVCFWTSGWSMLASLLTGLSF